MTEENINPPRIPLTTHKEVEDWLQENCHNASSLSYEIAPEEVGGSFEVNNTNIKTLDGFTTKMEEDSYFSYRDTPIAELKGVRDNYSEEDYKNNDLSGGRLVYSELKIILDALSEKKALNDLLPLSALSNLGNETGLVKVKNKI